MKLTTGKEYTSKSFLVGEHELSIENGLYGSNETRNELKIVEVDGFLLHNVSKITVQADDFVVFRFVNAKGEIVAERMMKYYESLTISDTSVNTLQYKFKRSVA